MKTLHGWTAWNEDFLEYLATFRNDEVGHPITYIVRTHQEVTDEQLAATYDSVDDQLIATAVLKGDLFVSDNSRVWDLLKSLVISGEGCTLSSSLLKARWEDMPICC